MKLFGDPLLVKASVDDQVSDIAARIQAKLQAKPEEFAAWKWSWHSNLAAPEELQVLIMTQTLLLIIKHNLLRSPPTDTVL